MVLDWHIDNGSSINSEGVQFNGDTGSNYAWRESHDGTADAAFGNRTEAEIEHLANASDWFSVQYIANLAAKEKLGQGHGIKQTGTGAGTAPKRQEFTYKWANTANAIDQYTMTNKAAGSYDTGSEVVVLGWDAADTHTSNFWEELDSVTTVGAGGINSNTFTAKKYLYYQIAGVKDTGTGTQSSRLQFNSDTGSNYAQRNSINGTDYTAVSQTSMNIGGDGNVAGEMTFYTGFIINNLANEKLLIGHSVFGNTAGAGQIGNRGEVANKWANTGAQITSIQCMSNDMEAGAIMKIWGSD